MVLKGTRTEELLRAAFAAEAQVNRRYLYFAQQADIEGYPEIAEMFRATAEAETGHAFGHLEFLEQVGDPVTGQPIGTTRLNLEAAFADEQNDAKSRYPEMARIARQEGFNDIADWFESLSRVEDAHASRMERALASFGTVSEPVE
ncbi:rubrerythrin [Thalassospira lucentensis]|jgi:rubrerythrin|uniref:Rubrerythrin n=2 Tax=Thalassospira TaxID=168934 RepID=A0A367XAG4_9PROT|nr:MULTISPECIES: rubrerythrin family protein [Thalassospira]KZB52967.1 rubrerythrin [Thalassospira xiamenensis]KZB66675.1 rubrerythrin [Thalassospira lucentensis]MAZ35239.1 rubrerythrin [Thalassospira sp.]MBO9506972.1 rubrerythrin family protein [Thalassospira sp. A3_1]MCH2273292.1 rubrerythrin family protein [Thalassospira sp.]|tara:strand:+ start:1542 stop:1979 length:438 start_codon:yes stop_codon:yes gene_type:complete